MGIFRDVLKRSFIVTPAKARAQDIRSAQRVMTVFSAFPQVVFNAISPT